MARSPLGRGRGPQPARRAAEVRDRGDSSEGAGCVRERRGMQAGRRRRGTPKQAPRLSVRRDGHASHAGGAGWCRGTVLRTRGGGGARRGGHRGFSGPPGREVSAPLGRGTLNQGIPRAAVLIAVKKTKCCREILTPEVWIRNYDTYAPPRGMLPRGTHRPQLQSAVPPCAASWMEL